MTSINFSPPHTKTNCRARLQKITLKEINGSCFLKRDAGVEVLLLPLSPIQREHLSHPNDFLFFSSFFNPPTRKKERNNRRPRFFINYSSFLRYPLFERHRFGNCGTCSQSSSFPTGKESGQTRSRLSFLVFFVFYCCGKRKKEEAPPLTETYDVHEFFFRGGGVENDRLNNNNNKKTHSLHQQSRFSLSLPFFFFPNQKVLSILPSGQAINRSTTVKLTQ